MEVVPTESSEAYEHDGPPYFSVSATLQQAATDPTTSIWDIRARHDPGLDQGLLRETVDTLLVDGRWLAPEWKTRDGQRSWIAAIEVASTQVSDRAITITPPLVEGIAIPEPISLIGIGPASLDTLRWVPGADITIGLRLPEAAPLEHPRGWRLVVERGDEPRLSINAPGFPPPEVVIPGNLIPDTAALVVSLEYAVDLQQLAAGDAYWITVLLHGKLDWPLVPITTPNGAVR